MPKVSVFKVSIPSVMAIEFIIIGSSSTFLKSSLIDIVNEISLAVTKVSSLNGAKLVIVKSLTETWACGKLRKRLKLKSLNSTFAFRFSFITRLTIPLICD